MGNDGGSIPTRRELVKEAAKDLSLAEARGKQKEQLAHKWFQCPITHKALVPPIVADCNGDLYNKEGVLQYLLVEDGSDEKTRINGVLKGSVRSLKDIVEVVFEVEKDEKTGNDKRVCPVTRKELGPSTRAVYIVPCGHAFSEEAVRQVKSEECIQCATLYVADRDVIPILPTTEEDKRFVVDRMSRLKEAGLSHSLKKAKGDKKDKKRKAVDGAEVDDKKKGVSEKKSKVNGHAETNGFSTKGNKQYENENIASLYTKKDDSMSSRADADFMTRGFSIPAKSR